MEYEVLVFSLWDGAYAMLNWNFRSACQKDLKLYCRQQPSFSKKLQNCANIVFVITLIKGINNKQIKKQR